MYETIRNEGLYGLRLQDAVQRKNLTEGLIALFSREVTSTIES